jgi:UV excision repair protein RAD23
LLHGNCGNFSWIVVILRTHFLFSFVPLRLAFRFSPTKKQEQSKSDLTAAGMKLIHSGKVLKDEDTITGCGIQPNDFLVVMIAKAKKPAAAAPAPAVAPVAAASAEDATSKAGEGTAAVAMAAAPTTPAPAAGAAEAAAAPSAAASGSAVSAGAPAAEASPGAPARSAQEEPPLSSAAVESLMGMGFPEAEVRHCLRAAGGNPDVAVEFLTQGIPDAVSSALASSSTSPRSTAATPPAPSTGATGASSSSLASRQPLQSLREHPQFDALRRLVQSNPAMLQQVLTQIGQQQPELLREINDNQALFLEMMNEPISEASSSATSSSGAGAGQTAAVSSRGGSAAGGSGGPFGPGGVLGSPAQMAALIQSMGDEEIQQMAGMMGLTVEQLRQTANLIGSLPEAELNQFMMQAMGGGAGGMDDLMGGGFGGGGMGGPQVVHLTEDEMAAVDRLTEMGFDRSEAAQAFLACDKNEALAANLLMDSMGDGGGFFGGGGGGGAGDDDHDDDGDDGDQNNDGQGAMDDDSDDMYD